MRRKMGMGGSYCPRRVLTPVLAGEPPRKVGWIAVDLGLALGVWAWPKAGGGDGAWGTAGKAGVGGAEKLMPRAPSAKRPADRTRARSAALAAHLCRRQRGPPLAGQRSALAHRLDQATRPRASSCPLSSRA